MKKAIYTVITAGYDILRPPVVRSAGYDYICFTDDPGLECEGWEMRRITPGEDPCKQQRAIKIMPHKYLPEYDHTVYIDGSHQLREDITGLIEQHFSGNWLLKIHPTRKCIYEEGEACIRLGKAAADAVRRQLNAYVAEGVPGNYGLYETGIMVRDNHPEVNAVCEDWHWEVEKHTHRDQLSLPAVLRRHGYKPQTIGARTINRYFTIHKHIKGRPPRIWYSTPFASDKNIGRAYNEFCEMVPDGDWICLRDGDSLFLHPHWGKQIEDIVIKHGNDYALMGCITNRLRSPRQLYNNAFSEDPDILNHKTIADELYTGWYDQVRNAGHPIAGLLMLFPKSTWKKIQFQENTIHFDSLFSQSVLDHGGSVGIMEGVYCFHFYRFDKPNPATYKQHLL
jgi:hypothetical protein